MSDMQMPGQPAPRKSTQQAVSENLSVLNPTDIAVMQQNGMLDPNGSIREFFATKGVDVDGPMSQFVEFAKREMANGNPLNKMKKIAGTAPQEAPPQPGGGQAPPPPPSGGGGGSIEELMGGM